MTRTFKSLALAALLGATASVAYAQQAVPITQSASPSNASMFLQAATGASVCATVNSTVANLTTTITPPAGQFVYITGVYVDITSDPTSATQQATYSATNINGNPFWSLGTIVPTASSAGQFRQISETYSTPLRSAVAGTAVTFAPSAQAAHVIICPRIAGFFAP